MRDENRPLLSVNAPTVAGYTTHDTPETPFIAPHEDRKGTLYSSFINLFLTAAGTGILSLPFTYANTGIVLGSIMLLIMAAINSYSMDLMVRSAIATGAKTYEGLGKKCFGRPGEIFVKINLLALLFGACILFMIVFVGLMVPFLEFVLKDYPHVLHYVTNKWLLTSFGLVLVFPLTLLDSLHGLRFTSTGGVICLTYVLVVLVIRFFQHRLVDNTVSIYVLDDIKHSYAVIDFFIALPIQGIAYCAQFSVMPLWSELQRPTLTRMNSIIYTFGLSCFLLYAFVGLFGYLLFGVNAAGNILVNFSDDDILVTIGRLLLAATILLKVPLCSLPFRETLNDLIFPGKKLDKKWIILESTLYLLSGGILAVVLKNLNTALGILGGTTGVCISFIIPGSVYLKSVPLSPLKMIPPILMIIFGFIVGVLSIASEFIPVPKP